MKTNVKNLAQVIANATLQTAAVLSLAIGLSSTANAQSVRLPGAEMNVVPNSAQSLSLPTELGQRANLGALDAGVAQRASAGSTTIGSTVNNLAVELPKAVDQAMTMISMEKLMNGESKATVVVGGTNSVLDEQSINVKVNYEARPIGGILIVRASMIPTFRGVGVSARPSISRSVAMAVDSLDSQQIKDVVRDLTNEINEEYSRN